MIRLCNEDGGLDCDGSNDVAPQTKFCEFLLNECENLYYVKYYISERSGNHWTPSASAELVLCLEGGEDVDDSDNSNDKDGYDKHSGVMWAVAALSSRPRFFLTLAADQGLLMMMMMMMMIVKRMRTW